VTPLVTDQHHAAAAEIHPHLEAVLAGDPALATPPANWTGTAAEWIQTIMALIQKWGPTILSIVELFAKQSPSPAPPKA
jgi:hypothetical protein